MKRIFIVHGWGGNPEEGWFPWLKEELEKIGFKVFVPQLPDADNPRIYNWVPALARVVGKADKETYFIGHSMGCQTIARYLENLPNEEKIGGAIFVAGFFKHLKELEDDENVRETDKHWFSASLSLEKVRTHLLKSIAIFSDDDPWVSLDSQDDFKEKLGSEIIIEHNMGHFSGARDKVFQLPVVLEQFKKLIL